MDKLAQDPCRTHTLGPGEVLPWALVAKLLILSWLMVLTCVSHQLQNRSRGRAGLNASLWSTEGVERAPEKARGEGESERSKASIFSVTSIC